MFICNGKAVLKNLDKNFLKSKPLYFVWQRLHLISITHIFYFIKYYTHFLFSPIFAYWNRFVKLPIGRKIFSWNGYTSNYYSCASKSRPKGVSDILIITILTAVAQPGGGANGHLPPPPLGLRQTLGRECTQQADQGENGNLQ